MISHNWQPIKYRDFHDIPRMFVVKSPDGILLFDCVFDECKDEYSSQYVIYKLATSTIEEVDRVGDWRSLPQRGVRIASTDISTIQFDPTKRQFIDGCILDEIM